MPDIAASLSRIIGPNPPFPPYPPYPPLPDLKLPESRLGCLLLGGLAGAALGFLLKEALDTRDAADAADAKDEKDAKGAKDSRPERA